MPNSSRWWSVKLAVDDEDLTAITRPGIAETALVGDVRNIRFGGTVGDLIDPPSLTFELQARDADSARGRAENCAYAMRRAARLPAAVLPIIWLAPSPEDPGASQFLDRARDLIDSEEYGLAVVSAQIHFEVHLRELLEEAAGPVPEKWARWLLKDARVAELKGQRSYATVQLLLNVDVTQLSDLQRFHNHVERRNQVVHRGLTINRDEARDSVAAVQGLWIQLSEAARR